jgi:hypothetical protein
VVTTITGIRIASIRNHEQHIFSVAALGLPPSFSQPQVSTAGDVGQCNAAQSLPMLVFVNPHAGYGCFSHGLPASPVSKTSAGSARRVSAAKAATFLCSGF